MLQPGKRKTDKREYTLISVISNVLSEGLAVSVLCSRLQRILWKSISAINFCLRCRGGLGVEAITFSSCFSDPQHAVGGSVLTARIGLLQFWSGSNSQKSTSPQLFFDNTSLDLHFQNFSSTPAAPRYTCTADRRSPTSTIYSDVILFHSKHEPGRWEN